MSFTRGLHTICLLFYPFSGIHGTQFYRSCVVWANDRFPLQSKGTWCTRARPFLLRSFLFLLRFWNNEKSVSRAENTGFRSDTNTLTHVSLYYVVSRRRRSPRVGYNRLCNVSVGGQKANRCKSRSARFSKKPTNHSFVSIIRENKLSRKIIVSGWWTLRCIVMVLVTISSIRI